MDHPLDEKFHAAAVARRDRIIENWEKRSAVPLAVLAIAFLALWAWQVLGDLDVQTWDAVEVGILFIWVGFVVDFLVRLFFHQDKVRFLRNNVIEIIALAVPAFRAFRILRVITAVGILTRTAQSLQARVNLYVTVMLPMVVFAGSLGVYEAEHRAVGATIVDFPNAVWWAIVTIFQVGDASFSPVTLEGRSIAVLIMLAGVALVSIVTINLAGYLLRNNGIRGLNLPKD